MLCQSVWLKLALAAALVPVQAASPTAPSNQGSSITVHVYKSGLFSAFAHNHVIFAPINKQAVDAKNMSVEIVVLTKEMQVTDPEASDSTRAEIQTTMLGPKVLDTDKYPQVHFKSSHVDKTDAGRYRVSGTLELHGTSKEISFEVSGAPDHYHGSTKLKQTEFGIQPVSIGGGTVKVKDQIEIDFDVYSGETANAGKH